MTREDRRRKSEKIQELRERQRDLQESAPDRAWNAWAAQHADKLEGLEEPWLGWIRRLFIEKEEGAASWDGLYSILDMFPKLGVRLAILSVLDNDDYEKQSKRHWDFGSLPKLPASVTAFSVLQEILATEEDAGCREFAVKWLPYYSADPTATISALLPLVADRQREIRWRAAIHLAHLAPDSLSSAEQLREALGAEWVAWSRRNWDLGCSGRGEAALALAQLGQRATDALPDLEQAAEAIGPYAAYHTYDVAAIDAASLIIQDRWDAAASLLAEQDCASGVCAEMGWAALPVLRTAKGHEDHRVREFALSILGCLANFQENLLPGDYRWTPSLALQATTARPWGQDSSCSLKQAAAAEL
jgi:hypothetical protein